MGLPPKKPGEIELPFLHRDATTIPAIIMKLLQRKFIDFCDTIAGVRKLTTRLFTFISLRMPFVLSVITAP